MTAGAWTLDRDHVNPRYFRVFDSAGVAVARVYREDDAYLIAGVPALVDLAREVLLGDMAAARRLAEDLRKAKIV